jgi:hypothetical protein
VPRAQENLIAALTQSGEALQSQLQRVQALVAESKAAKVDALRTEVRLADLRQRALRERNSLVVLQRTLLNLVGGRDASAPLPMRGALTAPAADTRDTAALAERALQQWPDTAAACTDLQDQQAQQAKLDAARAASVQTFSIGFEGVGAGSEKADEFEYSDLIARHFKTHHHKHLIPNSEVLARLPEAVAAMTEPSMSHDVIAFNLLAARVSRDVKVVVAGQGADEVFGGYFWYPLMDAESGPAVERFRRHYVDRDHAEYLEMFTQAFHVPDVTAELVARALSQPQADTFLDQVWRFDVTMLADPEAHFTRIQGSKLWHLAVLEWWLQVNVDGAGEHV